MELKKIQFSRVISNKKKYQLRDQGLNKINLKKSNEDEIEKIQFSQVISNKRNINQKIRD